MIYNGPPNHNSGVPKFRFVRPPRYIVKKKMKSMSILRISSIPSTLQLGSPQTLLTPN